MGGDTQHPFTALSPPLGDENILFMDDEGAIDLVVSDMAMPKMDGSLLTQKVHDLYPEIPIILCSGYNEMLNHDLARRIGASTYMMKPLAIGELATAIRETLDTRCGDSPSLT